MNICCTKKLFEYIRQSNIVTTRNNIKIIDEKLPDGLADSEVWDANLISVGRQKIIILCHRKTGYMIALDHITKARLKHIREEIYSHLKINLQNSQTKTSSNAAFLEKQLAEIVFYNTIENKSAVANLNLACREFKYLLESSVTDDALLENVVKNGLLTGSAFNYATPNEMLRKYLDKEYRDVNISDRPSITLYAELDTYGLKTIKCRRNLCVSVDLTFGQLHKILQVAFGWQNYHLHNFSYEHNEHGDRRILYLVPAHDLESGDYDSDYNMGRTEYIAEELMTIVQFFADCGSITYNYDFGDDWHIKIKAGAINLENHGRDAFCKTAVGMAPPEDVGGIYGFERFLEIMQNPKHPEYREVTEWYGDLEIKAPSVDEINSELDDMMNGI